MDYFSYLAFAQIQRRGSLWAVTVLWDFFCSVETRERDNIPGWQGLVKYAQVSWPRCPVTEPPMSPTCLFPRTFSVHVNICPSSVAGATFPPLPLGVSVLWLALTFCWLRVCLWGRKNMDRTDNTIKLSVVKADSVFSIFHTFSLLKIRGRWRRRRQPAYYINFKENQLVSRAWWNRRCQNLLHEWGLGRFWFLSHTLALLPSFSFLILISPDAKMYI